MKKVYFYATCLGTAAMQESVLNGIKLLRREGGKLFLKTKPVVLNPLLIQDILMKVAK